MRKLDMIDSILSVNPKCESANITRVYGVCSGVGYDINATIEFKRGFVLDIEAHANRNGWAFPEHLRPNNPRYKYTGSNDIYRERVVKYWLEGLGFEQYLNELKKDKLEVIYNYVMDEML